MALCVNFLNRKIKCRCLYLRNYVIFLRKMLPVQETIKSVCQKLYEIIAIFLRERTFFVTLKFFKARWVHKKPTCNKIKFCERESRPRNLSRKNFSLKNASWWILSVDRCAEPVWLRIATRRSPPSSSLYKNI